MQGADSSRAMSSGAAAADLGNEVFDDVGRAIVGQILAADSDHMCECLREVVWHGGHQLG